ncbi:MAG: superoxide dismutase [Bacteroidetes bacterium]|nr:superoxide dismutase [Bacteroidota bacterium]
MAFELPPLPYSFGSLEPHIDALTMEIHHDRHHNAYITNLNNAIAGTDLEGKSLDEILSNIDDYSAAVRNNGGGHYNHSLFWTVMSPNGGGQPEGDLAQAINARFGSFDSFKNEFSTAATTRFGSGWAWLCKKGGGEVDVCSSPNQDNPVMPGIGCGGTPILGLDVWEHAYYLKYQNKRPDYIAAFWNVINWEEVARRYAE